MKAHRSAAVALGIGCAVSPTRTSATPHAPNEASVTSGVHAADAVRLAPGPSGALGAWLLAGPFRSATFAVKTKPPRPDALTIAPPGVDETSTAPPALGGVAFGTTTRWTVAASGEGPIDVKKALDARESDVIAYVASTFHVTNASRFYVLVGADDGVRLTVDGHVVLQRDEARPERDDDDVLPVDLSAGDHALLFKLHQRDSGWAFRVRIVDAELQPPRGSWLTLPGTTAEDARTLADKMSWISVDRGLRDDRYAPRLTVRFPEGAPLATPLPVRARLVPARAANGASADALVDVNAGEVAAEVGALVVTLPTLRPDELRIEDQDLAWEIRVANRVLRAPFSPRRAVREAIAHAGRALAAAIVEASTPSAAFARGSIESVTHLRDRLTTLVSRGDTDLEAERDEARELDGLAATLEKHADPYAGRVGAMRRAYRSPADGQLAEYGLYVPPGFRRTAGRKWPLVVALHGLNGKPMEMVRWFFGGDDPKKDGDWEDRHVGDLPPLDAFVVTPNGHGNTMYRDAGLDDVMRVVEEVTATFPIDETRVTITGPSMGGIGTGAVAFRHPDLFAAAAPLCGYHSYFVRRDFVGRPIRPWERPLAEERSNVFWAWNGQHLPLFVVHGTQDLPEANSGVLIERYEALKYSIVHEHPNLGHNVWQTTYESLKAAKWLLSHQQNAHPSSLRFRTARVRDGKMAWASIEEMATPDAWAEIEARVKGANIIEATTKGVTTVRFERDEKLVDPTRPVTLLLDGTSPLVFDHGEPIVAHRENASWTRGPATHAGTGPWKHGSITGPLRDAFREPLLFVYGADDPAQTRANEEVARAWAKIRGGVDLAYPVMSDAEFLARGEPVANEHALFLVGSARTNRIVRELEPDLPIRIDGDAIVAGAKRWSGPQVGTAFVRPNPQKASQYVVVVEGVSAIGTWRSLSLPDLLPDFVVYDEQVAPARGQMLLGGGSVLAAGFFQNDWSLPPTMDDPLAQSQRPMPKNEADATPYLP